MRCKMCGAELKNDGDICKNCYEKYKSKIELNKIKEKEQFNIKRKYSPKFNILKNGEFIVILLIAILAAYASYNKIIATLITILCILFIGFLMFFNKKRALGTKITFYETKLKYKAKYLWVNREEVISYNEIKDVAYFQSFSQKINKIGDIRFYTNGFLSGLTMADVPEVKDNFQKIADLINSTRN